MNKGLIVVFNENDINFKNILIFKKLVSKNITICLVSNGNNSLLIETLENIEQSSDFKVSIVHLRKEKSLLSAVKAGVRSLVNRKKLDTILYVDAKYLDISTSYKSLKKLFDSNFKKNNTKNMLLRNIHAVHEV